MTDSLAAPPLIGVTTYLERAKWGAWRTEAALLPSGYPRMVQESGAVAVLLPPDDPARAAAAVARLDGVVVSGGPDVEPSRYGAARHPRTGPEQRARDDWESAVLRAALDAGTPLLGVCRGMQLLNVVLGGTLLQHLPERVGHDGHNPSPGVFAEHVVTAVPGTRLHGVVPEPVRVPTHHHQAVDRIGAGLVLSAYAEDGTVEGVEVDGAGFALGVQWHPEAGTDLRLFAALASAARP